MTAEKGGEGPVYGSSDRWRGVGLFLDSFDNDAQVSKIARHKSLIILN